MAWSNLCPSCCGNTGRLLHGICKYAGERIVAHGPLVSDVDWFIGTQMGIYTKLSPLSKLVETVINVSIHNNFHRFSHLNFLLNTHIL